MDKVIELRKQGLGYKTIAKQTGLNRDKVRQICLKYSLGGEIQSLGEASCLRCGSSFNKKATNQLYCSEVCRNKTERTRYCKKCNSIIDKPRATICDSCKKHNHKKCEACGKPMQDGTRKYCSTECKKYTGKVIECLECSGKFKEKRNHKTSFCSVLCANKSKARMRTATHYEITKRIIDNSKGMLVPVSLITEGVKSNPMVDILCLKCNKLQSKRLKAVLSNSVCSYCDANSYSVNSSGSIEIEKFLIKNELKYVKEKTFEDLVYINKLRYDFFVEDRVLIEYDGRQHYEPVWGGEEELLETKKKDKLKNDYAIRKGIKLIRISYKTNDIEKELVNKLKESGVL